MIPGVGGETHAIPYLIFSQFLSILFSQFDSARFAIGVVLSSQSEIS
jgi:hypothetical protein